jgi:hypothetical protein
MYIYIYIYVCVCVNIYVRTNINTHTHTQITYKLYQTSECYLMSHFDYKVLYQHIIYFSNPYVARMGLMYVQAVKENGKIDKFYCTGHIETNLCQITSQRKVFHQL